MQPTLNGFHNIKRYIDKHRRMVVAKILPGEFYVTKENELVTTVLGSCISACIWDDIMGIGGMNHFMLPCQNKHSPDAGIDTSYAYRYGDWAMEYLINEILKNGGSRSNLRVKIFGGGKILNAMTDIGNGNIQFAKEFLSKEQLSIVAEDIGGPWPRKVFFHPNSGKAQVKKLKSLHNDTIERREKEYMQNIEVEEKSSGDIELF